MVKRKDETKAGEEKVIIIRKRKAKWYGVYPKDKKKEDLYMLTSSLP